MNKILLRTPAVLLYLIAISCISIYIWFSLNPLILVSPTARLVLLCSACFTIYFGSLLISKTVLKETAIKIMKTTFFIFFIIFILLIATLTLFDSFFGRSGHLGIFRWDFELFNNYLKNSFNIVPFVTIFEYVVAFFNGTINKSIIITNILGNIIAFAPFAFFLPLFFKKMKSFKWFFITMLAIVILVELLQFAMLTGACDIDDVILNVGGACVVFGILNLKSIKNIIKKITHLQY